MSKFQFIFIKFNKYKKQIFIISFVLVYRRD